MPLAPRAASSPPLRVLVVDDDVAVRAVLAAYLKRRGHQPTAVETVAEAIAAFTGDDTFDVVVSDVSLPDGDGVELLNRLMAGRPALRGVCVTGGARFLGRRPDNGPASGPIVLHKPFEREAFLVAVEGNAVAPIPGG